MPQSRENAWPSISPLPAAGFPLGALPVFAVQTGLDIAMAAAHLRHPGVFERLRCLGDAEIIVDPVDLPLVFCLRAGTVPPRLRARRKFGHDGSAGAAVIRAPLRVLLDVFAATDDGDAAFFARDLVVEGDMSAVVALRNAIESEELVLLDDLLSVLGPFAAPARLAMGVAGAAASIAASVVGPGRRAAARGP